MTPRGVRPSRSVLCGDAAGEGTSPFRSVSTRAGRAGRPRARPPSRSVRARRTPRPDHGGSHHVPDCTAAAVGPVVAGVRAGAVAPDAPGGGAAEAGEAAE